MNWRPWACSKLSRFDPVTGSKRPPGQPSAMLGLAIRLQRLLDEWAEDGPDPLGRDELLNALDVLSAAVTDKPLALETENAELRGKVDALLTFWARNPSRPLM